LIYGAATGVLGQSPLSAFTRSLLGLIDQPQWQVALGISNFMRSVVFAPDAPSALTVLGALDVNAKAGATEIAGGTDNIKYMTMQSFTQASAPLAPRNILLNEQVTTSYTFQAIDTGYLVRLLSGHRSRLC
jgi:hypothetical protein